MRSVVSSLALVLVTLLAFPCPCADDGGRAAATTFGKALTSAKADALRPILPERGRVRLILLRLGPEDGLFGAQQVEALFRDFLAHGTIASFDLTRFEGGDRGSALAHGTAAITDRGGRSGRIGLHIGLAQEGSRWVLREVKETAE